MMQTVLLAGSTGMLGARIAHHLADQPEARVRLLLRAGADADRRARAKPLLARGVEVVQGDLADRVSLDRATEGVDVIVSAVQGGADVVVDGQVALAEAGRRNGVRRILPSDYALDLFQATPGEHLAFDLRRQADEQIATLGLEHVHVLQGAFMNLFLPGFGTISEDGVATFWGDGTQPIETTSVEDTARMTARVALDPDVGSGKFAFAGDRLSFEDAIRTLEEQTGRSLERASLGSEADLRAALAEANASDPSQGVMLAYLLYMLTGQTALADLQNDRYDDLALERFADFAARTIPVPVR